MLKKSSPKQIAVIGADAKDASQFLVDNAFKLENVSKTLDWKGGAGNPERSSTKAEGFDRHTIRIDQSGLQGSLGISFENKNNENVNDMASFLIIHGTGHNAGIDHDVKIGTPPLTPDGFMMNGGRAKTAKDGGNPFSIYKTLDINFERNKLNAKTIKDTFGNNKAKDNVFNKPIK